MHLTGRLVHGVVRLELAAEPSVYVTSHQRVMRVPHRRSVLQGRSSCAWGRRLGGAFLTQGPRCPPALYPSYPPSHQSSASPSDPRPWQKGSYVSAEVFDDSACPWLEPRRRAIP